MRASIINVIDEAQDRIEEILTYQDVVTADKIGLDIRAGRVYVTLDGIVVREGSRRTLEYYGGFEYVDRGCVLTLGDLTIYTRGDERVEDAIQYYRESHPEEEEEEEEDRPQNVLSETFRSDGE